MDGTPAERPRAGRPRADCITPRELVFNITLQCPLKCAHCCFSSDMFQQGHLSLADVERAIEQGARIGTLEIVQFVGGDPFLHADIMAKAIAVARRHGLAAGATTSAYWAKTPERARKVLAPLADAGMTEITLSYDDAHAAFVKLDSVRNALEAALSHGLSTRIAVVLEPGATLTAEVLRRRLEVVDRPEVMVYETTVNSTGRAAETDEETAAARAALDGVYRGPCLSVFRNITVNHDGAVLPCCGVLPHFPDLHVGHLHREGVDGAVRRAFDDPLLKWIAFEGPVAILADVTADDPRPLRPEAFDGICTACERIFGDPAMLRRVRARAVERADRIAAFELAYRAGGLYLPPPALQPAQGQEDGDA